MVYSTNQVDTTPFGFLSLFTLPDLIISEILQYLDTNSLKNLRLVSQLTKSWVEDNLNTMEKFECRINDEIRLLEVTNSSVPWNNFNFKSTTHGLLESIHIHKFMNIFGRFAKHFRFREKGLHHCNIFQSFLQYFGPQLQSLSIESVGSFGNFSNDVNLGTIQQPKRFLNLKYFEYMDSGYNSDYEAGIFSTILLMCPNLRTIRVSRLYRPTYTNAEISKRVALFGIYKPLIKYLKERGKQSKFQTTENLTINFAGNPKIGPSSNLDPTPYPLDDETLQEMIKFCEPTNTNIHNLPSSSLPKLNCPNWTKQQLDDLNKTVLSVSVVNVSEGLRNIFVPPSTEVNVKLWLTVWQNLSKFQLHGKIKTIFVRLPALKAPTNGLDHFLQHVFQVYRQDVEKLEIIKRRDSEYSINFNNIITNFPSLKKFELTEWG